MMELFQKIKEDFVLTFSQKKKYDLKILGFFLEDVKVKKELQNPLIKKEIKNFSLISETKTIYIALGKKNEFNLEVLTEILKQLTMIKEWNFDFYADSFVTKKINITNICETFIIKIYYNRHQSLKYKTKKETKKTNKINLITLASSNYKIVKTLWDKNIIIAQGVNLARDLQDCPPNLLNSVTFAEKIQKLFAEQPLVKCTILDKKQIQNENMNLLLAVNSGSQFEPRVAVLEYFPNIKNKKKIVALVGKGITFDTGGYSLKPSNYQEGMKYDMSGAAIVVSALKVISDLKIKQNVVTIVPITDNCIGSKAVLVESVITSKNGKTVEITNTDAEGRLILADAISYAKKHFTPKQIIELSTLTGSIGAALGQTITGAFSNNDVLYRNFAKATQEMHEPIWRMPVTEENFKNMKSPVADLANSSKTYMGGASNAAAFLFNFIDKTPFLHLDIAYTATKPENKRGTGIMLKSLVCFFKKK